ncbi:hypothetical protein GCM10027570_13190 [Streptomonospora sediminis]
MAIRHAGSLLLLIVAATALAACTPGFAAHTSGAGTASDGVVFRVETDDPVVFLTIDDGAVRDRSMAATLEEAGVPATLFLTSDYALDEPEFFRRLRDTAGARIETHGIDHSNLEGQDLADQKRQICQPAEDYKRTFGKRPKLFRPPYGNYDETTIRAAEECGASAVVHWSAELKNGEMAFASGGELRAGDIVLMHFRGSFAENVAEFSEQADRAGLRPALLENHLL